MANQNSRSGVVRLFSTAIIDQVMLSGANLLVGFLLIRFTTDFDYGLYVLVQSAVLLLVSSQGAWIANPLMIMASRKNPEEKRAVIGAVTDSQRRLLRRVVPVLLLAPGVAWLAGWLGGLLAGVVVLAIVAAWGSLRRDHLRNVMLIYSRPVAMLRADAIYVGVLLVGVAWASFGPAPAIVWVAIGLAAAAWAGTTGANRALAVDPGWVVGDRAAAWSELRSFGLWSLMGGVTYWLFAQSYSYVLATRLDLAAVADVNASRLLLMPAFVLSVGMQGLLTPMATGWNAQHGFPRMMRRLLGILLIIGIADVLYFGCVWLLRDWLIGDLLHKHIGDRDRLLLLWAGVAIIGLMRDVLQCALVALGRFKSMARQVFISAVVALFLMWFGTAWWGAAAVLIGQIAGEMVNLAGIILLVYRHGRSHAPQAR